jgi:hypothetical protein
MWVALHSMGLGLLNWGLKVDGLVGFGATGACGHWWGRVEVLEICGGS